MLGEIHDEKEITDNVLDIAENILGFEMCSIQFLAGAGEELHERARLQDSRAPHRQAEGASAVGG